MRKNQCERKKKELLDIFDRLPSVSDTVDRDERNKLFIAKTLQKLPEEIRERVLNEVIFVHTEASGTVSWVFLTKVIEDEKELEEINKHKIVSMIKPLVVLNFAKAKDSEKMDIIAHEIGHFVLKHNSTEHIGTWEEDEKAADDLAEKWGFNRSYKEYELRRK